MVVVGVLAVVDAVLGVNAVVALLEDLEGAV